MENPVIKFINHRKSGKMKNAEYIHKNGFFSPFGFTPKKYFNISPLINSKTIKKEENIGKYVYCQKKNIKSKLIHRNLYKEISSNTLNICNTNSNENLEKLINKY